MKTLGNYDTMAAFAAELFGEQDQEALLARYPLEHDGRYLFIGFLGDEYRIVRADGTVERCGRTEDGTLPGWVSATPQQALIILDLVCNRVGAPQPTGLWGTTADMSGAANSPSTTSLYKDRVVCFAGRPEALRRACEALGAHEVPGGEVSFVIDVFEGVPLWLQFWDADDEFPAQMSFLWDKATQLHFHYETLWYILFEVLDRLIALAA